MDIDQLIQKALSVLKRNMDLYPPFDSSKPYDEKNQYFQAVVELSLSSPFFLSAALKAPAERYYGSMLDAIVKYENQNDKVFNKGMVYANLGIAQIANGNLDEGIHHLLMADREDADFAVSSPSILEGPLWQQFESPHVINNLVQLNSDANASLHFQVTEAFIQSMLRGMDLQDRLFIEATIWTVFNNLDFNKRNFNDYTRGRLLSGLKDFCLLSESLLRKKQINIGKIQANSRITLGGLLTNAVGGLGIGYPDPGLQVSAQSLIDFLENLENIMQTSPSPEIRRIYCLHLVRNFTGHHFDVSSHIRSNRHHEFFDLYESALVNILSAILYFAHESLI